jgi:hypothetical protein
MQGPVCADFARGPCIRAPRRGETRTVVTTSSRTAIPAVVRSAWLSRLTRNRVGRSCPPRSPPIGKRGVSPAACMVPATSFRRTSLPAASNVPVRPAALHRTGAGKASRVPGLAPSSNSGRTGPAPIFVPASTLQAPRPAGELVSAFAIAVRSHSSRPAFKVGDPVAGSRGASLEPGAMPAVYPASSGGRRHDLPPLPRAPRIGARKCRSVPRVFAAGRFRRRDRRASPSTMVVAHARHPIIPRTGSVVARAGDRSRRFRQ